MGAILPRSLPASCAARAAPPTDPDSAGAGFLGRTTMRQPITLTAIGAAIFAVCSLFAIFASQTHAQPESLAGACCWSVGSCFPAATASQCVAAGGFYNGDGTNCSDVVCPTPPPTVVAMSTVELDPGAHYVYRAWSDGQVDYMRTSYDGACINVGGCGLLVLIPGTCTTDVNRDGDTGILDFLTLLGGWGACQ